MARVFDAQVQVIERLAGQVPGVEVTGFVTAGRKLEILRQAWVAVYPSAKEGFGLTVAEAMLKGTPVVATAVGGIVDQVIDGETGIRVAIRKQGAANTVEVAKAVLAEIEAYRGG